MEFNEKVYFFNKNLKYLNIETTKNCCLILFKKIKKIGK